MHHGDLSVPFKLALGHCPDCFSQVFPSHEWDISACALAGAFKISPGKSVGGTQWALGATGHLTDGF